MPPKRPKSQEPKRRMGLIEKARFRWAVRSQAKQRSRGERKLVGHWFKLNLEVRPDLFRTPEPSISGQRNLGKFLSKKAKEKVELSSLSIVRGGNVVVGKRQADGLQSVFLPTILTNFYQYLQGTKAEEAKQWSKSKEKTLKMRKDRKMMAQHEHYDSGTKRFAFNIGVNSIVEVGNDGRGNPTHILVLKRSSHVPIEPGVWDFPAGLIREGQHPLEAVRKRTAAELGVKEQHLQLIGPGLTPTKEEVFFTMMRVDPLVNYNPIVIQRVNISAQEIEKNVRAHIAQGKRNKDKLAPTDFLLIPRTEEAISHFTRTHQIFIPEVLRLYAQELAKEAKKRS